MSIPNVVYLVVSLALATLSFRLQAQSVPDCPQPPATGAVDAAASSAGRSMLVQGIVFFEAKNSVQAERAIQAALFAGLSDPAEKALAHKYLAYLYCAQSEWARCESEFDSAFAASTLFSLSDYELQGTPWRNAYVASKARWDSRCNGGFSGPPPLIGSNMPGKNPDLSRLSQSLARIPPVQEDISPLLLSVSPGKMHSLIKPSTHRKLPENFNVKLYVKPWAFVHVDGKRVGVTPPMVSLNLPAGQRVIELVNPGFESVKKTIRLTAGRPEFLTHDFESR